MSFTKRECFERFDGSVECFNNGFWYSRTGEIIKWSVLAGIFLFFMAWFIGGYMHAKRRMRKGLPLKAYHRWLVPYRERQRYGMTPGAQNHFTFYQAQQYGARPDGTYPEPPPVYDNNAPPNYVPPPGATKVHPTQGAMEMQPQYGVPPQHTGTYNMPEYAGAGQESGVLRSPNDVENQNSELPPRPQRAKLAFGNFVDRMRR